MIRDREEAFLGTVVRAFADDAELQILARRELAGSLVESGGKGISLEAARQRLDAVDAGRRHWRRWGIAATSLISLMLAVWTAWGFYRQRDEILWFKGLSDWVNHEIPAGKLTDGLSAAARRMRAQLLEALEGEGRGK